MKKNKLEELQRLANHQSIKPDPKSWDRISTELHGKSNKKYWYIAMGAVAAITTFALVLNSIQPDAELGSSTFAYSQPKSDMTMELPAVVLEDSSTTETESNNDFPVVQYQKSIDTPIRESEKQLAFAANDVTSPNPKEAFTTVRKNIEVPELELQSVQLSSNAQDIQDTDNSYPIKSMIQVIQQERSVDGRLIKAYAEKIVPAVATLEKIDVDSSKAKARRIWDQSKNITVADIYSAPRKIKRKIVNTIASSF